MVKNIRRAPEYVSTAKDCHPDYQPEPSLVSEPNLSVITMMATRNVSEATERLEQLCSVLCGRTPEYEPTPVFDRMADGMIGETVDRMNIISTNAYRQKQLLDFIRASL